jgi:hypothetical protein
MKSLITILVAGTLLATGGVALAQGDSRQSREEPQQEKKICRTDKATGSLTRRTRVCMTATQWRELHDRTRKGVDEMTMSGSGAPRCISAMDASCGAPGPGGL